MGFARMHMRGVLRFDDRHDHVLPDGYTLRRGGGADIEIAVALDDELDAVQRVGPSFSIGLDHSSKRDDSWRPSRIPRSTTTSSSSVSVPSLSASRFPTHRRGSFDHTLHLSAVTVDAEHRHLGVGTAMIDAALRDARQAGFEYVETNWRVTNRRARNFWLSYGFEATYVRLHRTIGLG